MITLRTVETDGELEAWIAVRRRVFPNEPAATMEQMRALEAPDRLLLLAERDGELAGSGLAARSDTGGGFVAPRVLPEHRRRGVGTALLAPLLEHVQAHGFEAAAAHADDEAALAFAQKHGFVEVDREVEQVREVSPDEPMAAPYDGVEFASIEQRPELLDRAFPVAEQGYADLALASGSMRVTLEEWLRDEATLPGGSLVALDGARVVGYAGLLAWNDDDTRAENGLTAVDREWRRRGLATALKRRQIAWAAANGIRELVTWTQTGNEGMRTVNEGLGYVTRTVSLRMRRELVPRPPEE
ncbi:MAG TPA: GNAT family N-acetyltransferase [Gaiellaceae bacterium]|nr:GNAT family N-acetyltransferase [Gaiellaceae bacterium]